MIPDQTLNQRLLNDLKVHVLLACLQLPNAVLIDNEYYTNLLKVKCGSEHDRKKGKHAHASFGNSTLESKMHDK